MCQILCESKWTAAAARREDDHVRGAVSHGRLAYYEHRDPDGNVEVVREEATKAAHAARLLLEKFGWNHLLTGIYRLYFELELQMANSTDPTHNICSEILELLRERGKPDARLLITSTNWGYIGHRPISYAIVERWMLNGFLERVSQSSESLWQLSQRGLDYLEGRVKESELVWPEGKFVPPPPRFTEENGSEPAKAKAAARSNGEPFTEDDELFTAAGNCRLCGKNSHVFGMISHAKSKHGATYEAVGQVQLVSRRKKTVAIIFGERPTEAPAVTIGVTETTNVTVYPKKAATPAAPAAPIQFDRPIDQMSPAEILAAMGVKK